MSKNRLVITVFGLPSFAPAMNMTDCFSEGLNTLVYLLTADTFDGVHEGRLDRLVTDGDPCK